MKSLCANERGTMSMTNFRAAAQFPFSMAYFAIFALNSGVNLAYDPFVFVELSFFEDSMISLFAAEITEEGSSSVSGPVGSGNLTCCSPLRFPTGLQIC